MSEALAPGTRVGAYEIRDRIGGGGMDVVYRARDTRLDRDAALKFLPPELSRDTDAKRRFLQEAKAASSLDHPNVCTIYEVGESNDDPLFITRRLTSYLSVRCIACVYIDLGELDRVADLHEEAYRDRDGGLVAWRGYISSIPQFDALLADPRFQDLNRRVEAGGKE